MSKFNRIDKWSQIKRLLLSAAPLSIGMMSQNLMSVVDSLMVSKVGLAALAAIGLGGFVIFIANAATVGFSTFVQRETAINLGAAMWQKKIVALEAAIFVALIFLPIYSMLLFFNLPQLLNHVHHDIEVTSQLISYVDIRLWAIVLVGVNFAFRGYYSATHLLRLYLFITLFMHLFNIALNYILIFGNMGAPALGIEGAAYASIIATLIATAFNVLILINSKTECEFFNFAYYKEAVNRLPRVLIPYGIQQMLFVAGFAMTLWIIGLTGTENLAIAGVILNVSILFFLPAVGFGIASAGFISHDLGAGNYSGIISWVRMASVLVLFVFVLLSLPVLIFTESILVGFFSELRLVSEANFPLKIAAMIFSVEALSVVLLQILFAVNKGVSASIFTTVLQWGLFLPIFFYWINSNSVNLVEIWVVIALYRVINLFLLYMLWNNAKYNFLKTVNKVF